MTKLTPHDYQEAAITRVLSEPSRSALIGSDMGTGKTLLATEILLRAGHERVLIMGVKDTFAQWADALRVQGGVELRRINATKAGAAALEDMLAGVPGFFFAGSEFITHHDWKYRDVLDKQKQPVVKEDGKPERERIHAFTYQNRMKKHPLDAVVFDEVHRAQSRHSLTYRTLKTIPTGFKLGMSGTWFGNSFEGAYAITKWLWPDLIPGRFDVWRDEWVAIEPVTSKDGRHGLTTPSGRAITKVTGEKDPGAFAASLPCYIRTEAAEQVPAPRVVFCEPTQAQRAQLEDLKRDLMTWVEDWEGEEAPLVVDMPAVLKMRIRQATIAELSFAEDGSVTFAPDAASAKLGPLSGLLRHYGEQPVAIYTDSKIGAHFIAARMRAAGASVAAWTGDLSEKGRTALKEDFIAGRVQYLVATIQSFGVGLDGMQRVCSKVVWISEVDGNPTLNSQAIARFFRPGRTLEYGEFEHVKVLMKSSPDVETFQALIAKAWAQRASMRVAA